MRALLSMAMFLSVAGCATTAAQRPASNAPAHAVFNVDAHTMADIVYDITRAQHYRVAVLDPQTDHTRFVMVPSTGGNAMVVYVYSFSPRSDRFSSCFGACASAVAVSTFNGDDARAQHLLDEIGARAQAHRLD